MSEKKKHPIAEAREVARQLLGALEPVCERVAIAGSIRRGKEWVGDIELVYDPKPERDLFGEPIEGGSAEPLIEWWLQRGIVAKRLDAAGTPRWGAEIKLAVHVGSGIPVDLFRVRPGGWASYLMCRTGSAVHNTVVARRFMARGMKWEPYDGIRKQGGELIQPATEAEIYKMIGWPMVEPEERSGEALARRGLAERWELEERRVG